MSPLSRLIETSRRTAAGERAPARLDALGTPLVSRVGPTTTVPEMLAAIDGQFPFGRHVKIRPRTVPSPTSGVRDVLSVAGSTLTSPCSAVSMHSLHGAAARVPVTETGRRLPQPARPGRSHTDHPRLRPEHRPARAQTPLRPGPRLPRDPAA